MLDSVKFVSFSFIARFFILTLLFGVILALCFMLFLPRVYTAEVENGEGVISIRAPQGGIVLSLSVEVGDDVRADTIVAEIVTTAKQPPDARIARAILYKRVEVALYESQRGGLKALLLKPDLRARIPVDKNYGRYVSEQRRAFSAFQSKLKRSTQILRDKQARLDIQVRGMEREIIDLSERRVLLEQAFARSGDVQLEVELRRSRHYLREHNSQVKDLRRKVRKNGKALLEKTLQIRREEGSGLERARGELNSLYEEIGLPANAFDRLGLTSAVVGVEQRNAAGGGGAVEQRNAGGTVEQRNAGGTVEQRNAGGTVEQRNAGGTVEQRNAGGTVEQRNAGGTVEQRNAGGAVEQRNAGGTVEQRNAGGAVEQGSAGGAVEQGSAGGAVEQGSAGGAVEQGSAGGAVEQGRAGGAVEQGSAGGAVEQRLRRLIARKAGRVIYLSPSLRVGDVIISGEELAQILPFASKTMYRFRLQKKLTKASAIKELSCHDFPNRVVFQDNANIKDDIFLLPRKILERLDFPAPRAGSRCAVVLGFLGFADKLTGGAVLQRFANELRVWAHSLLEGGRLNGQLNSIGDFIDSMNMLLPFIKFESKDFMIGLYFMRGDANTWAELTKISNEFIDYMNKARIE